MSQCACLHSRSAMGHLHSGQHFLLELKPSSPRGCRSGVPELCLGRNCAKTGGSPSARPRTLASSGSAAALNLRANPKRHSLDGAAPAAARPRGTRLTGAEHAGLERLRQADQDARPWTASSSGTASTERPPLARSPTERVLGPWKPPSVRPPPLPTSPAGRSPIGMPTRNAELFFLRSRPARADAPDF
jgi:hypothetical protein